MPRVNYCLVPIKCVKRVDLTLGVLTATKPNFKNDVFFILRNVVNKAFFKFHLILLYKS